MYFIIKQIPKANLPEIPISKSHNYYYLCFCGSNHNKILKSNSFSNYANIKLSRKKKDKTNYKLSESHKNTDNETPT